MPKDNTGETEYRTGFAVNNLFSTYVTGILTARDGFAIDINKNDLATRIADFADLSKSDEEIRDKYFGAKDSGKYPPGDTSVWKMGIARRKIKDYYHDDLIQSINYLPFDKRYVYYHPDIIHRDRKDVMRHFFQGENVGMITSRITKDNFSILSTKHIAAHKSATRYDISYIFPLYLYPDSKQQHIEQVRIPNLAQTIVESIEKSLGLRFVPEKQEDDVSFAPIDILDYIYAVLHSPSYQERYKVFLKTDFPKVPYPADKELFWKLVKLGSDLRSLHLMENTVLQQLITGYNIPGSNQVEKFNFESKNPNDLTGNVHINDTQYFEDVPKIAWEFYIGGYQPAQKWLRDRKGRTLTSDDLIHYQRIIVALKMTADIMVEIDKLPVITQ